MTIEEKRGLIRCALEEEKPELVLKNCLVADVFTGEFRKGDVAVSHGRIAGVGRFRGEREIDLKGQVLAPGFLDAHVHLESSMACPSLFARSILPRGTTTVVADPHEIANVAGLEGVRYLMEDAEKAPVNIYFMLPSCVPLNSLDHNGAALGPRELRELRDHPRVLGLGEMMDYEGAARGEPELLQKIELLESGVIDGHAPSLSGKALQAYRIAGVMTDHECSTWDEALDRLRNGFFVQVREGSAARNLTAILSGAVKAGVPLDRFVFCTDDMHLEDAQTKGHIDNCVRLAVKLGVSPIQAVRMATLNPARLYGLRDLGAVAPGYRADLVVLDSADSLRVTGVFKDGVPMDQLPVSTEKTPAPPRVTQSVHVPDLPDTCFRMKTAAHFPVIGVISGQIITKKLDLPLPGRDGWFEPSGGLLKLAVIQRHDGSGRVGLGAVQGFGLNHGAIASTVAHDSHNLIVIGDNDRDMLLAARELRRCQGGYTVVSGGQVKKTLPLPMAGLFTDDDSLDLAGELREMTAICRGLGVPDTIDPYQNLSFISLPVIPELRLTDEGIYDVLENKFLRGQ